MRVFFYIVFIRFLFHIFSEINENLIRLDIIPTEKKIKIKKKTRDNPVADYLAITVHLLVKQNVNFKKM